VIAGVDGTRGGWVVAVVDRGAVRWHLAADADEVLRVTAACTRVGVDIPIGLSETGYRSGDLAAREFLGAARSSIFHAPVRAVLDAEDYATACETSTSVFGKAISKQTWFIVDKIREWDRLPRDERVIEVHPECSFKQMGVTAGKKTALGVVQRIEALRGFVDPVLHADLPPGPAIDDVLDALAAAWTAQRSAEGGSFRLGAEIEV
jgi:predicted RNase H-like nuclease